MADLDTLREDYETAQRDFYALDAEHTAKQSDLRDEYRPRLNELGARVAETQKALCDAEAAAGLIDQPDGAQIAQRLVAEGGLSREAVEAAGITLPE